LAGLDQVSINSRSGFRSAQDANREGAILRVQLFGLCRQNPRNRMRTPRIRKPANAEPGAVGDQSGGFLGL
jgi:hypothetical protein